MTAISATLDRCLDDYDDTWQRSRSPPSLLQYYDRKRSALSSDDALALARELAMIDLEPRWRRFFNAAQSADSKASNGNVPLLPTWSDYCRLFEFYSPPVAGIHHEFRVRQLFGDRPHCGLFAEHYPEHAQALSRELTTCAAQLSRAKIAAYHRHRPLVETALPGRLEIGRRRTSEPAAPCYHHAGDLHRLIIAEHDERYLSRRQISLEFTALQRVRIENLARAQGRLVVEITGDFTPHDIIEVDLPCQLRFSQWLFNISASR